MPRPTDPDDDTPIYGQMLAERGGRKPGDLVDYLAAPWGEPGRATVSEEPVRAMYRVDPIPSLPESSGERVRPYVTPAEPQTVL